MHIATFVGCWSLLCCLLAHVCRGRYHAACLSAKVHMLPVGALPGACIGAAGGGGGAAAIMTDEATSACACVSGGVISVDFKGYPQPLP
jgi:hypothetical protein